MLANFTPKNFGCCFYVKNSYFIYQVFRLYNFEAKRSCPPAAAGPQAVWGPASGGPILQGKELFFSNQTEKLQKNLQQ